ETPGAAGYFGYFGAAAGDPAKGYYGYDVNTRWHVDVLNAECAQIGGCSTGSPMEVWFRADLAAHASNNVMVIWHEPRWSSGFLGNTPEMQALWSDAY